MIVIVNMIISSTIYFDDRMLFFLIGIIIENFCWLRVVLLSLCASCRWVAVVVAVAKIGLWWRRATVRIGDGIRWLTNWWGIWSWCGTSRRCWRSRRWLAVSIPVGVAVGLARWEQSHFSAYFHQIWVHTTLFTHFVQRSAH